MQNKTDKEIEQIVEDFMLKNSLALVTDAERKQYREYQRAGAFTIDDMQHCAKDFWEYGAQPDGKVNPYNDNDFEDYIKKLKDASA